MITLLIITTHEPPSTGGMLASAAAGSEVFWARAREFALSGHYIEGGLGFRGLGIRVSLGTVSRPRAHEGTKCLCITSTCIS